METLDRIMQMQTQGLSEDQIIKTLRNEGVSPSSINDALNHARIKGAVYDSEAENNQEPQQKFGTPSIMQSSQEMQQVSTPENMASPENQESYNPQQTPSPQNFYAEPSQEQSPEYYQQTPQSYSGQEYYSQGTGTIDTESISEIAEQVVQEKFSEFTKKTGDIVSFKNAIEEKVSDIDYRLKRIEDNISKLQNAIIGRIGEFGESNSLIHQDLDNLHGTMSKLMNPLVDNLNELKKLAGKE